MRGVTIHGALLLAALFATVLTWTGDRPTVVDRERTPVWNRDTTDVTAIEYRSSSHDIDITKRDFEAGAFLWGVETRRADDVGSAPTRSEFPAGTPGRDLVTGLAALGVIRDLGPIGEEDAPRFGLDEPSATITVVFGDERRELQLGNETPGDNDRYGLDVAAGRVYVIPGALVSPFENGVGALRERRLHYFPPSDVRTVLVESGGVSRRMVRGEGAAPGSVTWASPDAPESPDQGFANFMERVSQLSIEGFRAEAALPPTERRLRVEYFDEDGESMGFTELHRSLAGPGADAAEYFLLSDRVPVPADAVSSLAERVDTDLTDVF